MNDSRELLFVLMGAAIGGIFAAIATGDVWVVVVALLAGAIVYVLAGAVLDVAGDSLWKRLPPSWSQYTRVLVLAVAAAAMGPLYVFVGAWLAVIAVGLLVASIVVAILALMSGA